MKRALILAGGLGSRLGPYTSIVPKPLFPVKNESIIEIVLQKLQFAEIDHVYISLGHLGYLVEAVVSSKLANYAFKIDFLYEKEPLGTAGPLNLLPLVDNEEPILVINGDIYSNFNLKLGYEYFHYSNSDLLIIAKRRFHNIDYGVLKIDSSGSLLDYIEKPTKSYLVSTGMYFIGGNCILNHAGRLEMPDFILRNKSIGKSIKIFETQDIWYDLGRKEDFELLTYELGD